MRKEITVIIDAAGRDQGKMFFIRELSAMRAEKWGTRALLALTRSGVEIPDEIANAGLAGVATLGIRALGGVAFADAEPLLNEMMGCVEVVPDPARPQVKRALIEDDIEEVATLLRLREEVISLHTGFSFAAFRSRIRTAYQASMTDDSSSTAISPGQ